MIIRADRSTDWIHWAKLAAILGVIAVHTTGHNAVAEGARGTTLGKVAIVVNVLSIFAVPMFVMLSGALLLDPGRSDSDAEFLRKRAVRLLPALLFWHLFYYGFRIFYLDATDLTIRQYLVFTLNGRAFQALYYFWVILGLVLVTPMIRPWLRQTRRRYALLAGLAFAMLPVLTVATHSFRGAPAVWVETPWTWFIFYLGFYLLGWALRDVVTAPHVVLGLAAVCVAIVYVMADNWLNPQASALALNVFGRSYYHLGTLVLTCLLFVGMHSLIRADAPLRALVDPRRVRVARSLAGATLGVFALHSAIWWWLVDAPILGDDRVATSIGILVARYLVIVLVTYSIVLVAQRIPGLRRVV